MNVSKLIKKLQEFDSDTEVVVVGSDEYTKAINIREAEMYTDSTDGGNNVYSQKETGDETIKAIILG